MTQCYVYTATGQYLYPNQTDTDCDLWKDDVDVNVLLPDFDNDGFPAEIDAWDNDPTKPGDKKFSISGRYVHKDTSCTHTEYTATDGSGDTFYTTNCGEGVDPALTPVGDWWFSIPYANPEKTYAEIFEEAGGSSGTRTATDQTIDGSQGALLSELKQQTIKMDTTNATLSAIKTAIEGIEGGGGDMSGVESRLDTANQKLGEIKTAIEGIEGPSMTGVETRLDAIHADMPKMGSGDLPSPDTSMFETETLLGSEAVAGYKTESKSALFSLFDWFLANNPIAQVIENFEFSASGECSINVPMGQFGSMSVDAGEYAGFLQMLGAIIVALAAISGVLLILES